MNNNEDNNEHPEIHPNKENDRGALLNTTGKRGANRQVKGNDDGISKDTEAGEKVVTPYEQPPVDIRDKSQSYNGTNDADSNHTPHPETCDQ